MARGWSGAGAWRAGAPKPVLVADELDRCCRTAGAAEARAFRKPILPTGLDVLAGRLADHARVSADVFMLGERVVDKLPLVVVVLLLVDQDGLLGAGGREADDARAAEGLPGLAGAGAARTAPSSCPLPLAPVGPPAALVPVDGARRSGIRAGLPAVAAGVPELESRSCLSRRSNCCRTTKPRAAADQRAAADVRLRRWGRCRRPWWRRRPAAGRRSPWRWGLVLAEQNRLPIVFAGDRVDVFLAQEADFVGFDQRVGVGRIGVELPVVELDGADVLLAAVHGFELAVALDLLGDLGRGDGQRDGRKAPAGR